MENTESTAVLTPHLIHPNYFKNRTIPHVNAYKSQLGIGPVCERVRQERREWCLKQIELLMNNPSNAVLQVTE